MGDFSKVDKCETPKNQGLDFYELLNLFYELSEKASTKDSIKDSNKNKNLDFYELSEKDFYPPEDTRYYCSGVEDIDGGDNFADYAEYFFDTYGEEIFDY